MGRFEVRLGSQPPVILPSRRAQALLAYLAVPAGRAHPRDKLTGLLWPDADEDRARQSLRQVVLELRKRLAGAPGLLADDGALALDARAVEVDVATFEGLALAATPEALARAAALCEGDLLEGFHAMSPPFEEWLVGERERLRQTVLAALLRLLAQQVDGPTDPAIGTALRLLGLDPLQESVHRALMRLYVRQGRRTAALRQYRICAETLRRELDVAPSDETEQLYRELLREQVSRAVPETGPGGRRHRPRPRAPDRRLFPHPPEMPFVGRLDELARLREAFEDATRGRGNAVLVTGEAGIGKTSLVLQLVADVLRRGGRVLLGRCHESEQILPFGPWTDALHPVIATDGPQLLASLPEACCVELSRLFPTLDVPGPGTSAVSRDYRPLFEAIAAILDHLAADRPVALILEDVQWADDLSLRLLPFLARRSGDRRLLLVATAREEDQASIPGLRRLLEEIARDSPGLDRLNLIPLSREQTTELLQLLVHQRISELEAVRERAWQLSEGNPFVIVEVARAVQESSPIPPGSPDLLPQRVRAMVTTRLERLSEGAQHVLAVAAVNGRESRLDLLRYVTGLEEAAAIQALGELVRHQILDADGDVFAFTHERVREVAYSRLLAAQRRALHRAVAAGIEALDRARPEEVADRLAHHYAHGEHAPKAIEYLERFAEEAARRYALEDAVRALHEAMELAERLPQEEQSLRRFDLSLRLSFALSVLGRFREILDLLLPLESWLDGVGAPPALSGPYHCRLALTYSYVGEQHDAARHAAQAIAAARCCKDTSTAGKAHYTLALSSHALGDLYAGVEHGQAAVAALEESGEQYWLGLAYWVLGMNQAVLGEFEGAARSEAHAERIGAAVGDARIRSLAVSTRGWVHALRGDYDQAVAACAEGLELARDPISKAAALRRLGMSYLEAGDPETAVARLEEWLRTLGDLGIQLGRPQGLASLGEAHLRCGNPVRALALAGESLRAASADALGAGCARRVYGLVSRYEGRLDEAETELTEARRIFATIGARLEVGRTHLALAEVTIAQGRGQATLEHLGSAHHLFRALNVPRHIERVNRLARDVGLPSPDTTDALRS